MASATQMIRRDHKKVEGLFEKFDQAKKAGAKKKICEQVIEELEVHTKLEEEIFYPAMRQHIGEEDMLDEAKQEHEQAKKIIGELKTADAEEESFEDKFSELVDAIKHHVEEEEGEMLPKAEESEMDLEGYGEEMAQRKKELLGQASKKQGTRKKSSGRKPKSASGRRRSGRAA
jgi:Hemerythrin HHE cation binding domain